MFDIFSGNDPGRHSQDSSFFPVRKRPKTNEATSRPRYGQQYQPPPGLQEFLDSHRQLQNIISENPTRLEADDETNNGTLQKNNEEATHMGHVDSSKSPSTANFNSSATFRGNSSGAQQRAKSQAHMGSGNDMNAAKKGKRAGGAAADLMLVQNQEGVYDGGDDNANLKLVIVPKHLKNESIKIQNGLGDGPAKNIQHERSQSEI